VTPPHHSAVSFDAHENEEMTMTEPAPDRVMQLITGGWAASIVGAAARHGIFTALESTPDDANGIATRVGISTRGAQALLDGLTGLGLLTLSGGTYRNTPEASSFLVKGRPSYLGALAEVFLDDFGTWQKLPEAARTGLPTAVYTADVSDNPFWHVLVTAIAPLSIPVARIAADRLALAGAGAISWLDIGGGSGVWSAVWLAINPQALGFQIDWPHVNAIGREFVGSFGVGDRFKTIDGDFHSADFGDARYDYAICSHIAHQESPADNIELFRKCRRAVKPGGTFAVNDFVLNDDRTGHPFAMMFASQMLVASKGGFTYRQSDYRAWLTEAGFESVEFIQTPTPATVVLAR
jgi:ubiquinone/menaquinone biosynthesis C-methylase UbiE